MSIWATGKMPAEIIATHYNVTELDFQLRFNFHIADNAYPGRQSEKFLLSMWLDLIISCFPPGPSLAIEGIWDMNYLMKALSLS